MWKRQNLSLELMSQIILATNRASSETGWSVYFLKGNTCLISFFRLSRYSVWSRISLVANNLGLWVHLQGKQLCHFHFYPLFLWGSILKGKNMLLQEQILSFMSRLPLGKVSLLMQQNRKSQKLFPLVKKEMYPIIIIFS